MTRAMRKLSPLRALLPLALLACCAVAIPSQVEAANPLGRTRAKLRSTFTRAVEVVKRAAIHSAHRKSKSAGEKLHRDYWGEAASPEDRRAARLSVDLNLRRAEGKSTENMYFGLTTLVTIAGGLFHPALREIVMQAPLVLHIVGVGGGLFGLATGLRGAAEIVAPRHTAKGWKEDGSEHPGPEAAQARIKAKRSFIPIALTEMWRPLYRE